MHYIAIAHFPKDSKSLSDIASRRRTYRYPAAFANVQSYLDVQGGRAIVRFESEDAKAILRYEAALRLWLRRPGIGESAPACFKPRQPMRVAGDDDAVFIHFETIRLIHSGRDFNWTTPALIPGAQCRAIAKVIEKRTSAVRLLVKPGVRLFPGDLVGRLL